MPPFGFGHITSEKMLSLGIDIISSAYLTDNTAVSPSNLIVLNCVAVPVAAGCFYTTGYSCCFHSPVELGRNGEKCTPNV